MKETAGHTTSITIILLIVVIASLIFQIFFVISFSSFSKKMHEYTSFKMGIDEQLENIKVDHACSECEDFEGFNCPNYQKEKLETIELIKKDAEEANTCIHCREIGYIKGLVYKFKGNICPKCRRQQLTDRKSK